MRTVVDCVSSFIPLLSTEYEIVLGSFFPEEKMDYTKNQASWTLLYKKKRNLIDGSEHILYDRLKKDVK